MSKERLVRELLAAVRAARAAVDQLDEASCRALGINRTDGRCLDIVDQEGPVPAGRLAERSGLTPAAATAAIDRLERKGYLRRTPDSADRRRVLVELTGLARRRSAHIWGPLAAEATELFDYSRDELEVLIGFHHRSRESDEARAAALRDGGD